MIVFFTEIEEQYLNKRTNKWTVKDDCPEGIKIRIEKKLEYYYGKKYNQSYRVRNKMQKE